MIPSSRHSRRKPSSASVVRRGHVLGAPGVRQPGVLGADPGIVQARRDRVRRAHLPVLVLQDERLRRRGGCPRCRRVIVAEWRAGVQRPRRRPRRRPGARRVLDERVERAHRVRAAADAGHHRVGQAALAGSQQLARTSWPMTLTRTRATMQRERVRADDGADEVVRRLDVGDPVAHGLVDRVLQRPRARGDRHDLCAHELHAHDVEALAARVLLAHVDDALHAQQRGDRRGRDAVLAGTGLGDQAALAHALGEQPLAEDVAELVAAGVREVLALEEDACAAAVLRQPLGEVQRRGPAAVVGCSPRAATRRPRRRRAAREGGLELVECAR